MKKAQKIFVALIATALTSPMLVGCASGGGMTAGPTPMRGGGMPMAQHPVAPHVAPQQMQQQASPRMPQMAQKKVEPKPVDLLKERVRRLERAMIRLDRRMQLLERNELARISSFHMEGEETKAPSEGLFKPMSYGSEPTNQQGSYTAPAVEPQMNYTIPSAVQQGGFRPVSVNSSMVTSSLQVAPTQTFKKPQQMPATTSHLPSLADKGGKDDSRSSISVWTVNYDSQKVWPSRDQLAASRDVVKALRSDKPIALFARGSNPSSKEFRERVRALSKYLSKVSDMENVPIATMPAKHLDHGTIEILATN